MKTLKVRSYTRIVGSFKGDIDHENQTIMVDDDEYDEVVDLIDDWKTEGLHVYEEGEDKDLKHYTITL